MSKAAIKAAIKAATKQQWTTDELNIWNQPGDKAKLLGELEAGKKVVVTGREMWGRTEIVLKGESRWVTDGYLSDDKPIGVGAGLSMDPCPDGGVESGLTDNAVFVYRSVCNAFPEITSYGGWSSHGEHSSGRAHRHHDQRRRARDRDRRVPPRPRVRAAPLRRDLAPAHLDAGPRRRGLAVDAVAWLGDREPLRPRARQRLLRPDTDLTAHTSRDSLFFARLVRTIHATSGSVSSRARKAASPGTGSAATATLQQ